MTQEILKTKWALLCGKLQQKWPKLTDADVNQCDGHRDALRTTLQKRYGIAKEKAEAQIKEFERSHR